MGAREGGSRAGRPARVGDLRSELRRRLRRAGALADRATVVAFKRVVISYRAGNGPAVIDGDTLHLFVDPESRATDLYALRRQFGWKWQE